MFSNEYETYIKPYTRNYKKILYTIHKLNFTKKKRDIENQYIITIKAKPEKWIILNKIADILKTIFVITLLFLGVPLIWILVLLKLLIDNILETRSEKDGRITRIIKFIKEYWFFMFVVTIASKIIWPILTRIEQSHIQTISTFKNSTMT